MRTHKSSWLVAGMAVFTLLVTGCTSVQLVANKDAGAVKKLQRLFVLVNHGEANKQKLSADLIAQFRTSLTNSQVQAEYAVVSALDLDDRIHDDKIKVFNPDAVLVVRVANYVVDQYGGYPTIKYDVSLFDHASKKRVWRSAVNNSGGTALMERRMREMAEKIVGQLRDDGFL